MFTTRKKETDEICKYFSVDMYYHPVCTASEDTREKCGMHSTEEGVMGTDPASNEMQEYILHRCDKLKVLCDETGHLPAEIAFRYCEQIDRDNLSAITYDLINNEMKINTKADRNDPCPCGSGKKYKKCCGR